MIKKFSNLFNVEEMIMIQSRTVTLQPSPDYLKINLVEQLANLL